MGLGTDMKNDEITISRATREDASSLARFGEKTFKDAFAKLNNKEDFQKYVEKAFNVNQIESEILDPASSFLIAKLNGKWAGYAKLFQSSPPGQVKQLPSLELARLYSIQEYLGHGVGPALMVACIKFAKDNSYKSIWLGSWQKNERGNAFYKKMNFEIVGTTTFALGSDIQKDYIFAKSL